MAIEINDIAKEVARTIKEYSEDVQEGIEKKIDTVAKETAKNLRENSPKRKGGGDYAKDWTARKFKKGGSYEKVVHNKEHYQLTHLLEKGHAKRNGGRVEGIPHIEPAEESAIKKIEKDIEKIIKGGG